MKAKETCRVIRQEEISSGIFDLYLETPTIAESAAAGQFADLYCADRSRLLPRPISLCGIDRAAHQIRLVYRVSGAHTGTEEFSALREGDAIDVLGPLGNGFPLQEASGKRVFLIGGGIGIPPMLQTAKELPDAEKTMVLGYRSDCFLAEEFAPYGTVVLATEDGSRGVKGTVLDAIRSQNLQADLIFACGPRPMLRALKEYAEEQKIPCWISMEERMACGIGACLACVCESAEVDGHSHVHNKRVCKDGPVFEASEIVL